MAKQPKKKNFISKGGRLYKCFLRGNKVTVKLQRTAQGQSVVAGTYNLFDNQWENETGKIHVPKDVKLKVENFFLKTPAII